MQDDRPVSPLEYEARTLGLFERVTYRKVIKLATIVTTICIAYFLLRWIDRPPRDYDPRTKCQSNLRQLGLASIMYANLDAQHRMPDDLRTLFNSEDLSSNVLVCPSSALPPLSSATTQEAQAAIAANQVSYIYQGKGLTLSAPADTVLMYEAHPDHQNGINVLFVDAHVEWLDPVEANKLLARITAGENPVRYLAPSTQP